MKVCVFVLTLLSGSIMAQKDFDDIFRDILFADNVKSGVDEQQEQQQQHQQEPESLHLVQVETGKNDVNDSMNGTTSMEGTDNMENNENIGLFSLENSNCLIFDFYSWKKDFFGLTVQTDWGAMHRSLH